MEKIIKEKGNKRIENSHYCGVENKQKENPRYIKQSKNCNANNEGQVDNGKNCIYERSDKEIVYKMEDILEIIFTVLAWFFVWHKAIILQESWAIWLLRISVSIAALGTFFGVVYNPWTRWIFGKFFMPMFFFNMLLVVWLDNLGFDSYFSMFK
ncbi:MAG: hypothetical protein FH756_10870 [Firmicutes bacterium]|nr:hypothetical protein [Bacillota bacterium]